VREEQVPRVFLSYGHDEYSPLAERLKEGLEAAGLPTWFDVDRLKPGGDWERYIDEGLEWTAERPGEGRFVLLMTPHSVRRPDGYCLNELARAMARELPIVPVMVATVEPPLSIARLQWLDMCGVLEASDGVYEEKLERLRRALLEQDLDFEAVQSRLAHRLHPLSFDAEIHEHLPHFTGRRWIGDLLDAWLADPAADRVFWVTGGPGAGKTALSAWLTTERPELVAVHFCQLTNAHKIDPRQAAMSIAYQLSTQLLDYQQRLNGLPLETILEGTDAETLLDDLVVQPLVGLEPEDDRIRLILVDALDEATAGGQNELARLLAGAVTRLPDWLRLVLTSRPTEPEVAVHLQGFEPRRLEEAVENDEDLSAYVEQSLGDHAADPEQLAELVRTIVDRSSGSFLYARWVALEVEAGRLRLDDPDAFPRGLGAVYLRFFERQFPDLPAYKERQRPVLEAMGAAKTPLPLEELGTMLSWSEYDLVEVPDSFGSLVALREGTLHAFHLSVLEWVSDRARSGRYWAAPDAGRRRLADYCLGQYETHPDAMPAYAVRHGAAHLIELGRADESAGLLLDYRVLSRRMEDGGVAIADDLRDAAAAVTDAEQARALELVKSVFELAARILVRDPDQLASQLQARLLSHDLPAIRALVAQALALADVPLVQALTPALRQAGDPLTCVFRGVSAGDDDPDLFSLTAVALDDERDLALGAGEAGVVLAWKLSTGRLEQRFAFNESGFACAALDRTGGHWALGGWDGSVLVLGLDDLSRGLQDDETGGLVADIDVSPDGKWICTMHGSFGSTDGTVQLWDLETVEVDQRFDVSDINANGAVAFSPDGMNLAVAIGYELHIAPVTDLSARSKRATFLERISVLAYSPDGRTLAVGLGDGTIQTLPARGRSRPRVVGAHPVFGYSTEVTGLQFTGDGRLVSSGWDGALRVWDADEATHVGACYIDSKIDSLAMDPAGRWAMTGAKMGGPRLWDLRRLNDVPSIDRHGSSVDDAYGLAGRDLVVTGGSEADGATIRLWRASDGALDSTTTASGRLISLALSADEEALYVLDEGGVSIGRHPALGTELGLQRLSALDPAPESYWKVCLAEDVAVAIRSGYPSDEVIVWRAPKWVGKAARTLKPGVDSPIALSANGRVCAVLTDDNALQAFDLRRRRTQRIELDDVAPRGQFGVLALARSGALAAVGNENGVLALIDLRNGEARIMRFVHGDWIAALAFSGDETRLVATTYGGRLEVWDVTRGVRDALFCGSESWSAIWASERADRIVVGDAVGAVHFLERRPAPVAA